MNGIHDMGGMTCFGPVEREESEPVFHADWERRVFALSVAMGGIFGPIDQRRFAVEQLDPGFYLAATYYERWLARFDVAIRRVGHLTEEEISSGACRQESPSAEPPPGAEELLAVVREGNPASRDWGRLEPRFEVGDRVRARNIHPPGHTRLPRYVRGHLGMIERVHGTHVFPDSNAHGEGEQPQPLYSVGFEARELWGATAPSGDRLFIDLWEDHLEAAERKAR